MEPRKGLDQVIFKLDPDEDGGRTGLKVTRGRRRREEDGSVW